MPNNANNAEAKSNYDQFKTFTLNTYV